MTLFIKTKHHSYIVRVNEFFLIVIDIVGAASGQCRYEGVGVQRAAFN